MVCAVFLTDSSSSVSLGMKSFQNATRSGSKRSSIFMRKSNTRYFSLPVVNGGQGMVASAASTRFLSYSLGSLKQDIKHKMSHNRFCLEKILPWMVVHVPKPRKRRSFWCPKSSPMGLQLDSFLMWELFFRFRQIYMSAGHVSETISRHLYFQRNSSRVNVNCRR